MYWRRPTAGQLAGTGRLVTDFMEPVASVWPECWQAVDVFSRYAGQWRMGFNGPIALDYGVIHHALDRLDLAQDEYDDMLEMLRIIESEALEQLTKS